MKILERKLHSSLLLETVALLKWHQWTLWQMDV